MTTRHELHAALVDALGSNYVYYQPGASTKLHYPCIIYKRTEINTRHADNRPYLLHPQYTVTVISAKPDDPASLRVAQLPSASPGRRYEADNLYHDPYTIYL